MIDRNHRRDSDRTSGAASSGAGFSLVEVLAAAFLLGIVLLAAIPMFAYAVKGNTTAEGFGTVGALGLERMELLRTQTYTELVVGGSLNSNTNGYFDDSRDGFVVRWEILTNNSPANTKVVNVHALELGTEGALARDVTFTSLRGR